MATPPKSPKVLVVDPQNAGIDNFPSTPAAAQRNLEAYFQSQLEAGLVFHGQVYRDIGGDRRRPFWIFYSK